MRGSEPAPIMCRSGFHWAQRFLVAMWLCAVSYFPVGQTLSIDQIISKAMTSPRGYGLMYDEASQTVRVDMDMVLTLDEWASLTGGAGWNGSVPSRPKRQAIRPSRRGRYWPHGIIYYDIDRFAFSRNDVKILHAAMNEWMRYTCVKFLPAKPRNRNKIQFIDGEGCASNVGMARDRQAVTLSSGCRQKGVVIHELGHVLGFNHEQTRPDRDSYVKIRRENIPDHLEYNFLKYQWDVVQDLGVPYDYLSIMHYGKDAFSSNGRITIQTLDPDYQNLIGNRQGLSFRDIKSANLLYNCRDTVPNCNIKDDDCPGEGFVSKNCDCWCPTNRYGYRGTPYYVCHQSAKGRPSGSGSNSDQDRGSLSRHETGERRTRRQRTKCRDMNENCQIWADRGECSNNRFYMEAYCKVACGLCNTDTQKCRDEYHSCRYWREKGFCGRSSYLSVFITKNCRLTCGLCNPDPRPTERKISPRPCELRCRDEHEQCQEWASRGECTATADYMMRHCRKACNSCCPADHTDHLLTVTLV